MAEGGLEGACATFLATRGGTPTDKEERAGTRNTLSHTQPSEGREAGAGETPVRSVSLRLPSCQWDGPAAPRDRRRLLPSSLSPPVLPPPRPSPWPPPQPAPKNPPSSSPSLRPSPSTRSSLPRMGSLRQFTPRWAHSVPGPGRGNGEKKARHFMDRALFHSIKRLASTSG